MPLGGAVIAGGLAIGQTVLGALQRGKANRIRKRAMDKYNANPYEVPESARRSVNIMGRLAQGRELPGQDLMEERLASNTAQAVAGARRSATSPTQIMQSQIDAYLNQQRQQQELDLQAANDYRVRQGAYANAVQSIAPYEVERWKYRTLYPIQADLNRSTEMGMAGSQNIAQGLHSLTSTAANFAYNQQLGGMLGGGGSNDSTTINGNTYSMAGQDPSMKLLQNAMMNQTYNPTQTLTPLLPMPK